MPPKKKSSRRKTDAWKRVKAKQKAEEKKEKKEKEPKEKEGKKYLVKPLHNKKIKDMNIEEDATREFFESVLEMDDIEELLTRMNQFAGARGTSYTRKKNFEDIKNLFPEDIDVYLEFINAYLSQNENKLEDFLSRYKKRPKIAIAVQQKLAEMEEKDRLKAIAEDLFTDDEDDLVLDDWLIVFDKKYLEKATEKELLEFCEKLNFNCVGQKQELINILKKGSNLEKIYIKPIAGDCSKYIDTKHPREDTWYPVTDAFYELYFGQQDVVKEQDNDVMTIIDSNNNSISIQIGLKPVDGSIITQNKNIFVIEKPKPKEKKVKPKRPIKVIGRDGKVVEVSDKPVKTKYLYDGDPQYQMCVAEYRAIPWLNAKLKKIYIQPIDYDLSKYINSQDQPLDQGSLGMWYPVNQNFYSFVCGPEAVFREQDGEVLKGIDFYNNSVNMKLGFLTNIGFIIQDENIFAKEKAYYKAKKKSFNEAIRELSEQPIDDTLVKFGKKELSRELHKIAPQNRDYGNYDDYNTEYISETIDLIRNESDNTEEFFKKLGELVIYLQNDNAKIFRKRIIQEWYTPFMLVKLDISEKFPEANLMNSDTEKEKTMKLLTTGLKNYVKNMVEEYYFTINLDKRKPTKPTMYNKDVEDIETYPMKERCVNYEDVKDVAEENVVYYTDTNDSKLYCLNIEDIVEQIKIGDVVVNPYTNKKIDDDFLFRFKTLYYDKFTQTVNVSPSGSQTSDQPSTPEQLAPDLLEIVISNVTNCEKELLDDKLDGEGVCNALSEESTNDQEDEPEPEPEPESESESGSESESESESESGSDDEQESKKKTTPGDSTPENWEDLASLPTVDKCDKCGKDVIGPGVIKTIKQDGKDYVTKHYCCVKCLENTKYSVKRDKRKGGRKKTTDK